VPVLLYKLYGARTILNTIIQSLTPHNSMLNMSLVRHSVTLFPLLSFSRKPTPWSQLSSGSGQTPAAAKRFRLILWWKVSLNDDSGVTDDEIQYYKSQGRDICVCFLGASDTPIRILGCLDTHDTHSGCASGCASSQEQLSYIHSVHWATVNKGKTREFQSRRWVRLRRIERS